MRCLKMVLAGAAIGLVGFVGIVGAVIGGMLSALAGGFYTADLFGLAHDPFVGLFAFLYGIAMFGGAVGCVLECIYGP